jgi:sulfite exporter TauE/SafE
MPTWADLLPFVLLGLFGSLHCAGMCGGFALSVACSAGPARRRALGRALLYVLGKAMTYAVLGCLAAQAVGLVTRTGAGLAAEPAPVLADARRAVALLTALAFLALGLSALGVGGRALAWTRTPGRALTALFTGARSLGGAAGSFGLGLANGLLPCGLSLAALVLAAGQPAPLATLGLFAFGLATAPVLIGIAVAGASVPQSTRARLARFAAPAFLVLGLLTLARAGLAPSELQPDCCVEPPSATTPGLAAPPEG